MRDRRSISLRIPMRIPRTDDAHAARRARRTRAPTSRASAPCCRATRASENGREREGARGGRHDRPSPRCRGRCLDPLLAIGRHGRFVDAIFAEATAVSGRIEVPQRRRDRHGPRSTLRRVDERLHRPMLARPSRHAVEKHVVPDSARRDMDTTMRRTRPPAADRRVGTPTRTSIRRNGRRSGVLRCNRADELPVSTGIPYEPDLRRSIRAAPIFFSVSIDQWNGDRPHR